MDESRLSQALAGAVCNELASDLASEFIKIRRDYATNTLERASPGKFVETFVQCLQNMAQGKYDNNPNVERYLTKRVENDTALPDGLRLCGSRVARTIYTLRNKRNIAHKSEVDPNSYDLALIHKAAAWIMAEMIRTVSGVTMDEAGSLIEFVQAPVGTLVEEIDGLCLVHADTSVQGKILILLHSCYPDYMSTADIIRSLRNSVAASVRSRLSELRQMQFVVGDRRKGYRLTSRGYNAAVEKIGAL